MARAGKCPTCGEPVSQFAAGCAICGTDLETARAEHRARPTARAEEFGRRLRPSPSSTDTFVLVLLGFLVLFAPFAAVLLGALIAFNASREGDERRRNIALAAIVAAIALLFVGLSPAYELLSRL